MPVIIHNRKAHGDIYDILRHYRPDGVMHCFSGSVESAREALNMGLYIGLGGSVTFANAVKPVEVAKYVPLDRLVLETDAPYIIPRRFRTGEKKYGRSESWMIDYVAEFIAQIRGIEKEKLLDITANNAARLYGVKTQTSHTEKQPKAHNIGGTGQFNIMQPEQYAKNHANRQVNG